MASCADLRPSTARCGQFKSGTSKLDTSRFLQTLAKRLFEMYHITPCNPRSRAGVTFGDVLAARIYGTAPRSPETQCPLSDIFSEDNWQLLLALHDYTNDHVHSTLGRPGQVLSMVLPHEFIHHADDLKDIASLAGATINREDLNISDEAWVSSGSEGGAAPTN